MDCMVDLETLSSASDAAIISIGAVKFSPANNAIVNRFFLNVEPQSCVDIGMRMDADTIMWWMKQSHEARAQFDAPKTPIKEALQQFSSFLGANANANFLWGNGATFDNVILANAYKLAGIKRPWPFWADRCYRTVKELYPHITIDRSAGTHHNALSDAENQANHLMKIWPLLHKF